MRPPVCPRRLLPALLPSRDGCLPARARAAEMMCDPSYQDCRATLLNLIRNETQSIDVAMWFMEDQELADAIVDALPTPASPCASSSTRAATRRRRSMRRRWRNSSTPGIPMRNKTGGGILHWKFMIFNGRNVVQWSAANYGDYYFRPVVPYLDYTDEGIYFTDDPPVVDSFRRKFDDSWLDTTASSPTPTSPAPLARRVSALPDRSDDELRAGRELLDALAAALRRREPERIDVIMYQITDEDARRRR